MNTFAILRTSPLSSDFQTWDPQIQMALESGHPPVDAWLKPRWLGASTWNVPLYLYLFPSLCLYLLPVWTSIYRLPTCLFVWLTPHLSISLSVSLCLCLSLSLYQSLYQSIFLSLSLCLSISWCLCFHLSPLFVHLSMPLSLYRPIYLVLPRCLQQPIYLFIYLSITSANLII